MKTEILSFTGLRGIAALYVVLFHLWLWHMPEIGGHAAVFLNHGFLMVDLFFVLSGFVMAMTYGSTFSQSWAVKPYLVFLARRVARVWPTYMFATLLTITLYLIFPRLNGEGLPFTPGILAAHFTMTQAFGLYHSYMGLTWSVSTEWGAYLVFPLIAMLALRSLKGSALMAIAGYAAVLWLAYGPVLGWVDTQGDPDKLLGLWKGDTFFPLIRCFADFTLGSATFYVVANYSRAEAFLSKNWVQGVMLVALLGSFFIPKSDCFAVLLFPLLVISLSSDNGWVSKLLCIKPLQRLGDVSYSLYLVHLVVMWAAPYNTQTLQNWGVPYAHAIVMVLTVLGCILLGTIVCHAVEKPSRGLMRKLLRV